MPYTLHILVSFLATGQKIKHTLFFLPSHQKCAILGAELFFGVGFPCTSLIMPPKPFPFPICCPKYCTGWHLPVLSSLWYHPTVNLISRTESLCPFSPYHIAVSLSSRQPEIFLPEAYLPSHARYIIFGEESDIWSSLYMSQTPRAMFSALISWTYAPKSPIQMFLCPLSWGTYW